MLPSGSMLRAAKRQRTETFQRGAVMKVRVENFMTYAKAEINPGPRLNLVLGPNGTGKSSLVCAICVGLVGGTKLLGRAEDVSSFVRRGTSRGWVEVTLSAGEGRQPYVIRRLLTANSNSSEWELNGRHALERDVRKVVEELHIQLDNLCQFLPQDKVVEFARMKPVQLLAATEQAIDNGRLHEQHMELVEERAALQDHESAAEAVDASLTRLRADNERNRGTVEQLQKRNQLLEEVEAMEKKVPWLVYQAEKELYDAEKAMFEETRKKAREREQALRSQEGPRREKETLAKKLEAEWKRVNETCRTLDAKINGTDRQHEGLEAQVQEVLDKMEDQNKEMEGLAEASRQRQAKIVQLEGRVRLLEEELASLPPSDTTPEITQQRQRLMAEQADINVQLNAVKEQSGELAEEAKAMQKERDRLAGKLRKMDDAKMQRLQALEGRTRNIANAHNWLQRPETKQMFRGRVFGPIAAEVECPNPLHAKYLEQHVANNVWSYFVVEHESDQDLLRSEISRRFGFTPSVANYTGNADAPIEYRHGEAGSLARYGITHTLDQVFVAPSLVKHVLCNESGINMAFVGTQQTQEVIEQLLEENREVQSVWVPKSYYKRTHSKYNSSASSIMVNETRDPRILVRSGPEQGGQERQLAQARIKETERMLAERHKQLKELEAQEARVGGQLQGIKQKLDQLTKIVQENAAKRRMTQIKASAGRKELQRLQAEPDPLTKKPQLERKLGELRKRAFMLTLELTQAVRQLGKGLPQLAALHLARTEAKEQVAAYARADTESKQLLEQLQRAVQRYELRVREMQASVRRKKQEAEQVVPLTPELNERFAQMPDTLEALQREIDEKRAEADGICINNPAALDEYNRRCQEIHRQEGELAQLKERLELSRAKIEEVKGAWLPRLKGVVEQINEAFGEAFAQVGCAGEVVLKEAEGEDFAHYAIEIRVKFRESEELQTLDANRQSGGERSVSTMLYLISLQGITVTPFRVVDEINQGMDPINERKIFMQLVQAACSAGTPQCFLLTPKLLPDLPFTPDVKVLQIMNGPFIKDVATNFSMEKLLGSQRMSQLTQLGY